VGRTYAGILGFLAFQIEVLRGLLRSAGAESTLWRASLALFAFALLGYVAGELASWVVEESVHDRVAAEAAAHQAAKPKEKAKTG
jgi:hypothetical protein